MRLCALTHCARLSHFRLLRYARSFEYWVPVRDESITSVIEEEQDERSLQGLL